MGVDGRPRYPEPSPDLVGALDQQASVSAEPTVSADTLAAAVRKAGYDVAMTETTLQVEGMTGASRVRGVYVQSGVSGNAVWGYLSGNGLLSAIAGGHIAAHTAAHITSQG